MRTNKFGDWPLRWKILAPFAAVSILFAALGTYLFARATAVEVRAAQSARLRDALAIGIGQVDRTATARSKAAARLAYTQGMAGAVKSADTRSLERLVIPLAVNSGANLTAVVRGRDRVLLEVALPSGAGAKPVLVRERGGGWESLVSALDRASPGDIVAGLIGRRGATYLAVAIAVQEPGSSRIGAVVVGDGVDRLLAGLPGSTKASLSLVAPDGRLIAGSPVPRMSGGEGFLHSRNVAFQGRRVDVLARSIVIGGTPAGSLVAQLPAVSGLGALGERMRWVGLLAFLTLAAVFGVGMWVSGRISGPLSHLVSSTRALARGSLEHRAPVEQDDEVGELAAAFNQMADAIEASHRQLEGRVEERTRELREVVEDLDRTNAELARANEAKSLFLANVSHELRTPLSGVLIASEMLHDPSFGSLPVEKVRTLAGRIHANGRHLLALIDDVLDLSRIEAGKLEIRPEPLHLRPLLDDIGEVMAKAAADKGVSLRVAPGDGHVVMADPVRVRQVLLNLLDNAAKFTDPGGSIEVRVSEARNGVGIVVSDTGIGIAAGDRRRIFEPFEQVAHTSQQGTGLGLAISRSIASLHGGDLTVRSAPGKGSTFTLTLPRARGHDDVAGRPAPAAVSGAAPNSARILLVEDDPPTLESIAELLRVGGHPVLTATTAGGALERVHHDAPDLMLLDVRLGAEDGLDVVRAVRADPTTRSLPVVALSAHAMQQDVDEGMAAGCDDYIVKPVGGRELFARIDRILGGTEGGAAVPDGGITARAGARKKGRHA